MTQMTKKALAKSLQKLLSQRTLDKITVIDIVEDCGVNRQTFYYHFRDVYALLEWIFMTEAEKVIAQGITNATWTRCLNKVFEYLLSHQKFVINAYRSVGLEALQRYLFSTHQHYILHIVQEIDSQNKISDEDKRFIENFYAHAFVGIIVDWISGGMKEDYQKITEKTERLLTGTVERFINN
ncbi:MAG: TetR/AcrR family transcriptional regulator [Muricomes sp.]